MEKTLPTFCTNSANVQNYSGSSVETYNKFSEVFSIQDKVHKDFSYMLAQLM